jgi:hypothetical protein
MHLNLFWYVPNPYALHCLALQTFEESLSRKKCDGMYLGNRLSRNKAKKAHRTDGGVGFGGKADCVENNRLSPNTSHFTAYQVGSWRKPEPVRAGKPEAR